MSVKAPAAYSSARLIIVMGPTGCGKSTIGRQLAEIYSAVYIEGDDHHSAENKQKMHAGTALTDEDRWPWLREIAITMKSQHGRTIASCSSLKRAYREFMARAAGEPILYIYLHGSVETLSERLSGRQGHFMNSGLLNSQLATLEAPGEDEYSVAVSVEQPAADIVEQISRSLG